MRVLFLIWTRVLPPTWLEISAQKMTLIAFSLVVLMQISLRCCGATLTNENNSGWRCDFDDGGGGIKTSLSAQSSNVLEICNGWTMPVTLYNVTDFAVTSGNECYDNATARGGPPKDYSLRTRLGGYAIFMSDVEEETRAAQLLSPWFKSSPESRISLEFAMNMYGDGDRELSVHVRRKNRPDARLWIAYGDKGTSWIYIRIGVGRLSTDYQFVFRAVREFGDIGHIALDAIAVRENDDRSDSTGDCPVVLFRCQTGLCISRGLLCDTENNCIDGDDEDTNICSASVPLRCDFETDPCGWTNVGGAGVSWKRLRARERKAGPVTDHTTDTDSGHYIQVKTAEEDSMGLNAIFESPLLPPPPPDHYNTSSPYYNTCQLRFFYFMKGSHINGLSVHLRERPRGCEGCGARSHTPRLLQPLGHSGISRWLRSSFALPLLTHRFVVQFEVVRALPTSGIVAIDDVSMTTECQNDAYDMSDVVKEVFQDENIISQPTIEHSNETLNRIIDADVVESLVDTPGVVSAVVVVCAFLLAVFVFLSIYFVGYHRQRRLKAERLLRLSIPECSLSTLQTISHRASQGIVTQYNPNYCSGATASNGTQELRELSRDRLVLVRALGQGAFGEVYQGYLSTCDSGTIPVAAKTLAAMSTSQAELDFLMEALIMSKFKHPNIVRFIGVCFEKRPQLIVLELLNGGDVKTFLRKSRNTPERTSGINYVDLVQLALDVGSGCEYLEINHFIHRDVAARNCLLTTRSRGRVAKIADFGMARDIYGADYYRKGGKVMLPVKWMPPEAFLDGIFTSKTDVWSFGVLLWEIFTFGRVPYPGRGNQEVMTFVTEGGRLETPTCCPPPADDLMTLCWLSDPDKRPSFRYIVDRLRSFLTDADVISARLPVFHLKDSREEAGLLPNPPSGERQPSPSPQQFQKPRSTANPGMLEFQCEDLRPERSDSCLLRSDSWLMRETEA